MSISPVNSFCKSGVPTMSHIIKILIVTKGFSGAGLRAGLQHGLNMYLFHRILTVGLIEH